MFYRAAPGKVVRTRRPRKVAREMRMLHDELGELAAHCEANSDPAIDKDALAAQARAFVQELTNTAPISAWPAAGRPRAPARRRARTRAG